MILKNKKILVTGGAGFIGSHLVDKLVEKENEVTVVDNLSASKLSNLSISLNKINFLNIDIRDAEAIDKAVMKNEIVFHLAANADVPVSVEDPELDFTTNVDGSYNVLKSCLKHDIKKVIFASSAAVYGNPLYTPISEKHPTVPISPYGASKLAIERLGYAYYKTFELPFVTIRIFNTFGERQPRYVMYDLLKKLYRNKKQLEVLGTGKQIRDYCYVEDSVNCFILAAENDKAVGEVFNLAGGNPTSIKELTELLVKELEIKNIDINFTGKSWKGDINLLTADTQKAKNILGFSPKVPLKNGIHKLNIWMQENNR